MVVSLCQILEKMLLSGIPQTQVQNWLACFQQQKKHLILPCQGKVKKRLALRVRRLLAWEFWPLEIFILVNLFQLPEKVLNWIGASRSRLGHWQ